MKRRSFFGALLGAASAPLVKAPAPDPQTAALLITSGDYSGSVEVGDKFFGVDRGPVSEVKPLWAWIPKVER